MHYTSIEFSAQLNDHKLLDQLKAENFDIAFGNMYEMCSFGLMKVLNISNYGWFLSSVLVEHPAMLMGVPTPPSYVPGKMLMLQKDCIMATLALKKPVCVYRPFRHNG